MMTHRVRTTHPRGPTDGHRAQLRAVTALIALVALGLTACGGESGSGRGEGHGAGRDESHREGSRAGGERLITAAEAGMERASSFGFDSAGFFTEDAVEEFRDQMGESMAEGADEVEVDPEQCADPLAAVDWAPLLLDSDAARVDFGSETFTGTGSIEVADVSDAEDSERVDEHFDHVRALVESCPEVAFSRFDSDFALKVSAVEPDELEPAGQGHRGTIAYSWERGFGSSDEDQGAETMEGAADDEAHSGDGTVVAQILFTRKDDDVVMVSFIGEPAAGSSEFTEMAESITDYALDSLEESA